MRKKIGDFVLSGSTFLLIIFLRSLNCEYAVREIRVIVRNYGMYVTYVA